MKNHLLKSVFFTVTFFSLIIFAAAAVRSQTRQPNPELCAAGFCIGENEEAVKAKLQGFSPRYDNELQRPKYFFYNEFGDQVMSITAYSKERPHLLVGIEVFGVDQSYRTKHFQMKNTAAFTTESGFFIGLRPSATSMIFGVPNSTGPKEVIKKKGKPVVDEKPDKFRILRYKFGEVKRFGTPEANSNKVNFNSYTAEYRFYKKNLRRLIIAADVSL
jgi:hypothetical protein